jgi:transposase
MKESMIYSWRAKQKTGGTSLANQKMQKMKLSRLKRENKALLMENAFLKKAAAYFAKESK